ncbi:N-acetylglucosamine-6-phosphate deacetylase [Candidatus Protochlamydia phocaeensis]|uniref:N-acetylglucosamine-6-phosphate deacetylase n=1 Tax=Candidatus Protochlamydia phocaeensis TaxID=1414722 RepID=UPI000837CC3C|nr:N-acetylglucosamine-6-phosphate deacetylase [Candidatus Protochlamydia phocaeensis]
MRRQRISRYYNAQVLKSHEIKLGEIWVANGKIIAPQAKADEEIDAQGLILAPGYIDLQVNGGFCIDFATAPSQVHQVAKQLPRFGVTAFLPTLISRPSEEYPSLLPYLQPTLGGIEGAAILGIHLEGPFLNAKQAGAHSPSFLNQALTSLEGCYGSLKGVRMVTLAPELPGALEAIRQLKSQNIVVAAGHTQATVKDMEKALEAGVKMITHLFNAMAPFHHREPGVVGTVLTHDSLFYSLIADGVHVHADAIKLAWRSQPQGLILVSDAMEAFGLPPGSYQLGASSVIVEGGSARLSGTQTLAGSIIGLDQAVRIFFESSGCSIADALEAASLKPAQVLGIEKNKGTLQIEADADFIVLDEQLEVHACYIGGELAWKRETPLFKKQS